MSLKNTSILFGLLLITRLAFSKTKEEESFRPVISPFLYVQFWNVVSEGITAGDETLANRYAAYFRRGRFGVKGKVLPELSYSLMLAMDNLGKDGYASTKGVVNLGAISVWSACFTYKVNTAKDWLNITGGYFLPHLSRESTQTPWTVSSLDKAENSCYIRQFVSGKANGVCPGINLGGTGKVGRSVIIYNAALINRQDVISKMNKNWSPVFLGHAMINFGDTEFSKYKFCFSNNVLKKQTSVTFGVGASTQGKTDAFRISQSFSADATVYFGGLKLNGEFNHLYRKNQSDYRANCIMGRAAYNMFLKMGWIVEPSLMYEKFSGDDNYEDASFFDGTDQKWDFGVNLISKQKQLRVNLHYVFHEGMGVENRYIKNNKYSGNYVVLGLQCLI